MENPETNASTYDYLMNKKAVNTNHWEKEKLF